MTCEHRQPSISDVKLGPIPEALGQLPFLKLQHLDVKWISGLKSIETSLKDGDWNPFWDNSESFTFRFKPPLKGCRATASVVKCPSRLATQLGSTCRVQFVRRGRSWDWPRGGIWCLDSRRGMWSFESYGILDANRDWTEKSTMKLINVACRAIC